MLLHHTLVVLPMWLQLPLVAGDMVMVLVDAAVAWRTLLVGCDDDMLQVVMMVAAVLLFPARCTLTVIGSALMLIVVQGDIKKQLVWLIKDTPASLSHLCKVNTVIGRLNTCQICQL